MEKDIKVECNKGENQILLDIVQQHFRLKLTPSQVKSLISNLAKALLKLECIETKGMYWILSEDELNSLKDGIRVEVYPDENEIDPLIAYLKALRYKFVEFEAL